MSKLHSLLLSVLLLGTALPASSLEVTGEVDALEMEVLFVQTCVLINRCDRDVPPVLYAELERGTWGLHFRESSVVFLTQRFQGMPWSTYRNGIIVHEMVHYILDRNGLLQDIEDTCRNEALAWSTYNRYVTLEGRPDLVNPDWSAPYPYCDGSTYTGRR